MTRLRVASNNCSLAVRSQYGADLARGPPCYHDSGKTPVTQVCDEPGNGFALTLSVLLEKALGRKEYACASLRQWLSILLSRLERRRECCHFRLLCPRQSLSKEMAIWLAMLYANIAV